MKLTCITIAIHCTLEIFVRSTVTMTKAVMKITPDLVRAIVPGSASLYETKIYITITVNMPKSKIPAGVLTVLLINA